MALEEQGCSAAICCDQAAGYAGLLRDSASAHSAGGRRTSSGVRALNCYAGILQATCR